MKKYLKLFLSYLKLHQSAGAVLLSGYLIFAIVLSLSTLPLDAIFYAALLNFVFLSVFLFIRFFRYCKKHQALERAKKNISFDLETIPEASNLLEQDYQLLLSLLHEEKTTLKSNYDRSLFEMTEYYTMWVHQIKTPIAAMSLLLQSSKPMDKKILQQELFKIECYVEMVLGYLRMEQISSDLLLKEYNLSAIIRQAIKKYSTVFIYKKISLDFQEPDCFVLTDEKWLVFVIEQLLSNALKYTQKGSISIYLKEKEKKILVIEDTGIGIQEEDLPRVFERGFTGYNGHMDKKSTGIGLYLCKKILKKLSHSITLTSTLGQGTKVFLDLTNIKLDTIE